MASTRNELINLLVKDNHQYISGQALSEKLNITRNAVWKHMEQLKKDGYVIEAIPRKGYKVIDYPRKVSSNTVQWGLNTKWLGNSVIHHEITSSTQLLAHDLAAKDYKHGTVVIADEQLQGKGRMDRRWHSAKNKGVWMSLILRPNIPPQLAPQLTLLSATVLASVFSNADNSKPQIKWPNDILINGKKVAGILTEMKAEQDQVQYIIIGIGINALQDIDDFPEDIKNKASSLMLESNIKWDIRQLIQSILVQFEKTYDLYTKSGFSMIKQLWERYSFKLGEPILIKTMKNRYKAIFHGIDKDGALLIKKIDGTIDKIYSAEIDWFKE